MEGSEGEKVAFEVVQSSQYPKPKRKRKSKYSAVMEAAVNLEEGKALKIEAKNAKIGSLRALLQKEKGKFGITESEGYIYVRKK